MSGQPRSVRRLVMGTAAVLLLTLGGVLGLILAQVYLASWAVTLLWIGYALLVTVGMLRLAGVESGCQSAFAVVLLAFVAWLPGASAATQLRLDLHGRTTEALVVDVQHSVVDRDQRWQATLHLPDGTPVPGPPLLDRSQLLHPGDTVRVVFDPDGTVAPRRPADVHPWQDTGWSLAFAVPLAAAVVWAGLRGRRGRKGR
ncbi:hypothetical protein [Kitasatospora viridis]|uniref:DUF3592 domain-containing protein n=1 Tax=Kitasatospora viridis TaxID=281105 RepID=A0A561T6A8_9ACTN|nr:hypothetical protein [Kitasatospora viridis]TWF82647.1 hypothetical protein FHX73_14129 [Kitasatospora viridis]